MSNIFFSSMRGCSSYSVFERRITASLIPYSYSIDRNTDQNRQFSVDANGLITVTGKLDREKMAVHRVHILAIDKGNKNIK